MFPSIFAKFIAEEYNKCFRRRALPLRDNCAATSREQRVESLPLSRRRHARVRLPHGEQGRNVGDGVATGSEDANARNHQTEHYCPENTAERQIKGLRAATCKGENGLQCEFSLFELRRVDQSARKYYHRGVNFKFHFFGYTHL